MDWKTRVLSSTCHLYVDYKFSGKSLLKLDIVFRNTILYFASLKGTVHPELTDFLLCGARKTIRKPFIVRTAKNTKPFLKIYFEYRLVYVFFPSPVNLQLYRLTRNCISRSASDSLQNTQFRTTCSYAW